MFMVLAAALLSTFLTNDVALFIVVPLTITLKRLCEIPVNRLIIFEALAVNAGSLLTPNWQPAKYSDPGTFWSLVCRIYCPNGTAGWRNDADAPAPVLVLFPWKGAAIPYGGANTGVETAAGVELSGLYIVFLTALEFKQELWGLVIVAAGFALLARRVVLSVDWTLLLVFMAMFIDVHLLTQLPALQGVLGNVSHLSEPGLWLTAIGLSQVISNVPSTISLLNYVPPSLLLVWAVNVGGFGLLPGSLANLIALRMANDRRIWWRFHLYSIPMLSWAALVGYVLLVILPAN
ncbi:SLC13 family permease [Escherichia coli]